MRRPPRAPDARASSPHGLWQHAAWVGLLMGGVTLATQAWALQTDARALAEHDVHRADPFADGARARDPLRAGIALRAGIVVEPRSSVAVGLTSLLQLATLYVPALNPVFKTEPLSLMELLVCLGASTIPFAGAEIEKWLARRGWLYREVVRTREGNTPPAL